MELAAVVFSLKIWRHYLYGEQFEVFSDHKNLKYIFTERDLNMRQRRWMEFLEDSIQKLTKSTHFLAVRMTFTLEEFYRLYIREIVRLHGVSVSIVSDRDLRFTAHFWKSFQKAMGTQLSMSTAFHPQTDGQSELTIQILEDMLRACVLDLKGSWEEHLPLVEFAYNNSYQTSIQMTLYEAHK